MDEEEIGEMDKYFSLVEKQHEEETKQLANRIVESLRQSLPIPTQSDDLVSKVNQLIEHDSITYDYVNRKIQEQVAMLRLFKRDCLVDNPTDRVELNVMKAAISAYAAKRNVIIGNLEISRLVEKYLGIKRQKSHGKTYFTGVTLKKNNP